MATEFVKQHNQKIKEYLNFDDKQDFEDARRGFIADIENGIIKYDDIVYQDVNKTKFLEGECPETVNPSLWRLCQLNRIHGLFEVIKGKVYQFRGYDMANMSFIRGEKGWIVIDTLSAVEGAKAGIELLRNKVENLPVTAVIVTHSHGDHCNGLESVLDEGCVLYWPKDLVKELTTENLFSGVAMNRRCTYMYGITLPKNEKGFVGTGLGANACYGKYSHYNWENNVVIDGDVNYTVDGIEINFMFTPGAEAPTEMMMYFPQLKAICTAEEINRLMHNLYTPRGAKVRNGKVWANYIDNILLKYGEEIEVSFGSHNWPTWGNENIINYYEKQRDMYKFLHDQTLRYSNLGYTPNELPDVVVLPDCLAKEFFNRGYYGTVNHNIKAQYQFYLGYFDGNPVHLNDLPPTILGKKYVEAIGGEDKCYELALEAYEKGEYQWALTLLNNVIFANPKNYKSRELMATVYTQMAYMQESAVWRNEYLVAAMELRDYNMKDKLNLVVGHNSKTLLALKIELLFNIFAIYLNYKLITDINSVINVHCLDTDEKISLIVKNCVLNVRSQYSNNPNCTLSFSKDIFWKLFSKEITKEEFLNHANVKCEGNPNDFITLVASISIPSPVYEIVEPKQNEVN